MTYRRLFSHWIAECDVRELEVTADWWRQACIRAAVNVRSLEGQTFMYRGQCFRLRKVFYEHDETG